MAKYIMTVVLLTFIALENNSIYSRLHVKSLPSGEVDNIAYYVRQHMNHMQLPQAHEPNHKTAHRPAQHHGHHKTETEEAAALRHYVHLQRHFEHQRQHQTSQQHLYQQRARERVKGAREPNLKMPRIWQHLQDVSDEGMFNDEAVELSDSEIKAQLTADVPSASLEDEGFAGEDSLDDNNGLENSAVDDLKDVANPSEVRKDEHPNEGVPMRCPKCESSRQVEHISEEELTRLRIEFVKQQILEKLRLKERPKVSAIGLPKPIYDGITIDQEDVQSKNKELDDYYARTSKKFIFLEREKLECERIFKDPSMCFSFKITDADADGFDVNKAVLWIFKNKQSKSQRNNTILDQQTIVVSEVIQQQFDSKYIPLVKTIAIQSVDVQDEWMKIDIEWPIKRWFGNHDLSHLIHISCESCDIESMDEWISVDKDYRPFIMVDTQNRRRQSRQKRSINCTDGVTECCREKLYISFDDIGWGDWIIQPRGYDAYFCRGACNTVASVTQSASHHSTFLQKVLSTRRGNGRKPLELIPCCTAKQYSSLQLVFMDSNNTATQKTFPNMVVESCGCR